MVGWHHPLDGHVDVAIIHDKVLIAEEIASIGKHNTLIARLLNLFDGKTHRFP